MLSGLIYNLKGFGSVFRHLRKNVEYAESEVYRLLVVDYPRAWINRVRIRFLSM